VFTLDEQSAEFYASNKELWSNLNLLLKHLTPLRRGVKFPRHHVIFPSEAWADRFYILRKGFLRFRYEGTLVFFIEPGDMVDWPTYGPQRTSIFADGDVVVDEYSKSEFIEKIRGDAALFQIWLRCLGAQHSMFISLIAAQEDTDVSVEAEVRQYHAGEVIIQEKSLAHEVCTMREGVADVWLDSYKVGEVHTGEIFGALSAITAEQRQTSVVAKSDCIVSSIPREDFLVLLKVHPETVLQLLDNLAHIIEAQNRTLADLYGLLAQKKGAS